MNAGPSRPPPPVERDGIPRYNRDPERLPNLDDQGLGDDFITTDWSPDGRFLAGIDSKPDGELVPGVVVYSFEAGGYRRLTDFGHSPVFLDDSRRLLFADGRGIHLLDLEDGHRTLLLEASNVIRVRSGPGSGTIYFNQETREADIWLMSFPHS